MNGFRIKSMIAILFGLLFCYPCRGDEEKSTPEMDEKILREAELKTDDDSLLSFIKKRTLSEAEKIEIGALIRKLGAGSFRHREQATAKLIERGPAVLSLLEKARKSPDLEISSRADRCIDQIEEKDVSSQIYAATVRLIRKRQPKGTLPVLHRFLALAQNVHVIQEV